MQLNDQFNLSTLFLEFQYPIYQVVYTISDVVIV
jgi:hypothetical protein